jgi:hypothetical protein
VALLSRFHLDLRCPKYTTKLGLRLEPSDSYDIVILFTALYNNSIMLFICALFMIIDHVKVTSTQKLSVHSRMVTTLSCIQSLDIDSRI